MSPTLGHRRPVVSARHGPSPTTRSRTAAPSCAAACSRRPWPAWSRTCRRAASRRAPPVLALLRDALAKGRAEIRRRFEEPGPLRNDGPAVLVATSYLMDQIIRVLFDFADQHAYPAANPSAAERLGLVATGGYGRGELAPLSDIDLLFLRPYKQTPRGEQIVEFMLYLLWDLGLKVGHATRTVDESLRYAERDQTIRTALLEARYLWGDRELLRRAAARLRAEILHRRRPRLRRRQAGGARPAPPAHGRFALRRRAQRQGRQGRAARPAPAVLDRQVSLPRERAGRAGRQGRAHARKRRDTSSAPSVSSRRCAATSTI